MTQGLRETVQSHSTSDSYYALWNISVGAEMQDVLTFQTGNFFEDAYPPGADVFFLSHVLHDWGREDCLRLLQRCYEALPTGGVVIAAEFLLNEEKTGPLLAAFQGLHVFYSNLEAKQWTGSEIQQMMAEVGFKDGDIRPIDPEQSIVIGWKR